MAETVITVGDLKKTDFLTIKNSLGETVAVVSPNNMQIGTRTRTADLHVSGVVTVGSGTVKITSNDVQFGSQARIDLGSGDLRFFDVANSSGKTLTELAAGGGGGAPTTADYLVKTADGTLSAERVVTDTTSITVDWSTAGQAKIQREALGGDVTASQNSNTVSVTQARGLRESSGTTLTMGTVSTSQILACSGSSVLGVTPRVDIGCDDIVTILTSSTNTHYERHPSRPSVIRLRSPNNFPTARTLSTSTPEFGWTTTNMSLLTTKDENTTSGSSMYGDHDATNTDWNVASPTCPARWQTFEYSGQTIEIVGLCYNNGNAAWENTGIVFANNANKAIFVKMFVGYNGNVSALRVSSNQNTGGVVTGNSTPFPTAAEILAGVWLRMVVSGNAVTCWYNFTASSEPPTTWTFLQAYTLATGAFGTCLAGHIYVTVNTANHLTGGVRWFGWRSDAYTHGWPGTLALFQGTRRATAGDTIKLIASADFGHDVLPSQTKMRLILADAINRIDNGTGTWTFGITSSGAINPSAPATLQAASAVELKLSGTDTVTTTPQRYWAVFASCASTDGEQEGNLDTALVRIVT